MDNVLLSSSQEQHLEQALTLMERFRQHEEQERVDKTIKLIKKIYKNETVIAFSGHFSAGKSTMINLLLRFYDFKDGDSGQIYIDGIDIDTYSKRTYRNHIGLILQDPMIYKGTIASNIKFGQDVLDEKVEQVLREIGGGPLIDKLPEGIHQPLLRGGSNLSVGEKQLISFARAVLHDPAILIMDEATANIDTETEGMIQTALNKVKLGRTTIVIAHRLSTIKHADKIVVLDNGYKVEEGTHDELLALDNKYAHIYKSQMNVKIETV